MWFLIPSGISLLSGMADAGAQQAQYDAQAEQITLDAEFQSMQIQDELNKVLDYQQAVGAGQGRVGGSLDIIAEADKQSAEFDMSLLGAQSKAQASQMKATGARVANAGLMKAIGQSAVTGYKFKKLG